MNPEKGKGVALGYQVGMIEGGEVNIPRNFEGYWAELRRNKRCLDGQQTALIYKMVTKEIFIPKLESPCGSPPVAKSQPPPPTPAPDKNPLWWHSNSSKLPSFAESWLADAPPKLCRTRQPKPGVGFLVVQGLRLHAV